MMPQVTIPTIGSKLKLTRPWTFTLRFEYRNKLWDRLGLAARPDFGEQAVTLPVNTVLKVDRIYIRKGKSGYDSITFYVQECSDEKLVGARFWARLADVNEMMAAWEEETIQRRSQR